MRSWAPPALAGVAFSLPYVDAAASLLLKPESASLPKPESFSLLKPNSAYLPTKPALSSPLKDPS